VLGRNTQGVRLISLHNGEKLVGVERIVEVQDDEDDLPADEDGGQAE
jgi:DNA gyrase subunit A